MDHLIVALQSYPLIRLVLLSQVHYDTMITVNGCDLKTTFNRCKIKFNIVKIKVIVLNSNWSSCVKMLVCTNACWNLGRGKDCAIQTTSYDMIDAIIYFWLLRCITTQKFISMNLIQQRWYWQPKFWHLASSWTIMISSSLFGSAVLSLCNML